MRLPAVAIAAVFACGAVLGQVQWFSERTSSRVYLAAGFALVGLLICAGIFLARIGRLFPATAASTLSWLILGVLGAGIANEPRPADYILSLVETGRVGLKTPLQWHGHLRDEPARLPWGYGYEIELTGVEYEGALVPARGGLRVSFSESPGVGDEVVVATEAKRPQVFRDEGAFDRRAYLEQQNIDLVATLRAPKLMERIAASPTTAGTLLARARRRLRDEIDTLFAARPGEDNPYGHPNPELIERLETAGVRILRTDRDGAAHILTDGNQLEVSRFVECSDTLGSTAPVQAQTARSREATRATAKNQ